MGVCCCLQTFNSVFNMSVMGLVLGPSLMVISITGILLYVKVSPLYNVLWECIIVLFTRNLHCLQTYCEKHAKDILISCGFMLLFTNM